MAVTRQLLQIQQTIYAFADDNTHVSALTPFNFTSTDKMRILDECHGINTVFPRRSITNHHGERPCDADITTRAIHNVFLKRIDVNYRHSHVHGTILVLF